MDLHPTNQAPQDLLHSATLAHDNPYPRGYTKRIVTGVLSVLLAFAAGFFLSRYFADQASLTLTVLVIGVYVLVAFFDSLLGSGSRLSRAIVALLQAGAIVLWIPGVSIELTVAFFVIALIILLANEIHMRRELHYGTQIRFFRLARPYISNMVTLIVLAMLAFYLPGIAAGKPLLSPDKLDQFGSVVENVMHLIYPTLPQHPTAGAVAEYIVQKQFANNDQFKVLPPKQQQMAIEQGRNQLLNEFGSSTGVFVKPNEQFGTLAGALLQSSADRWRAEYGVWFLVFWVVVAFIFVRSLGFIFSFVVAAIAYGIYHLLLGAKMILVEGESTIRETVSFN
jgi:hypothetical protein